MNQQHRFTLTSHLRFIIPSLLGVFLFMIPIPGKDGITIPIAVLSGLLQDWIGSYVPGHHDRIDHPYGYRDVHHKARTPGFH